jgi:hypothetical protein
VVPLLVENELYTVIYYFVVRAGAAGWDYVLHQMSS